MYKYQIPRNNALLLPVLMLTLATILWPGGLDAERSVFRASSRIMSVFALPGESVTFDLAT